MTQTSMNQRLVRQRKTFLKPVLASPSYNRALSQAFPRARKWIISFPAFGGMRRMRPHGNGQTGSNGPAAVTLVYQVPASVEVHLR